VAIQTDRRDSDHGAQHAAAFTDFPLGGTSGTYDPHLFDLTVLSFYDGPFVAAHGGTAAGAAAALIGGIIGGQSYFNIHTENNGGGENPRSTCSRSHRWCWTARPDLGGRWPSRLVATAAENRLSFRRNPHTSFAAVSDCRTIAIYDYTA
jgi:hypothetical protein